MATVVKKKATKTTMVRRPRKGKGKATAEKVALFTSACCVGLMAVSVAHLADALTLLTHSPLWIAYSMALVIDAGMLGCKMAVIFGGQEASRHAKHYLFGATGMSMMLNCTSFCSHMVGAWYWFVMPIVLGVLIPLGILMLGSVAAKLYLNK
jgi:hypothetical protein